MHKGLLAFSGLVLISAGLGYTAFHAGEISILKSLTRITSLPGPSAIPSSGSGSKETRCHIQSVNLSSFTISEQETAVLTVLLSAPKPSGSAIPCSSNLSLETLSFSTSPSESQDIALSADQENGSVAWVLSPQKTGTFQFFVRTGDKIHSFVLKVTNIFGLSPSQAQLVSSVGGFFGSTLTFPFWFSFHEKQREEKERKKSLSSKKLFVKVS